MLYSPPKLWYVDADPLVYLAGSFDELSEWQNEAIKLLQTAIPSINIANPAGTQMMATEEDYHFLIEWRIYHQRIASANGVLLFFIDDNFGEEDMFEFAEWLTHLKYRQKLDPERKLKLILGMPDKVAESKYIKHRIFQDLPDFKIYNSLEYAVGAVIEELK